MKTIGIIGGMSWESTQLYYRLMNEHIHAKLGGHHSVEAILYSVDFEKILTFVHKNKWDEVEKMIIHLAEKLKMAGADFLILASNAIHKVFSKVEEKAIIPILHIADPTGEAVKEAGMKRVSLLGTKVSMEEGFYKERLQERYGIESLIPQKEERESLHRIIFEELTLGMIRDDSRDKVIEMIEKLKVQGAEGVILGCTELSLLIRPKDTSIPLFDTTALHAKAAVDRSIKND